MNILLLSPHDDDHALFASFLCMRLRPLVIVVTDSFIQPARGEIGCSAKERAAETETACGVLGCEVARLGIPDNEATKARIMSALYPLSAAEAIYAPAVQGGNNVHDWVGEAAIDVFGPRVVRYTTYTKTELYTTGDIEIAPTLHELAIKEKALDCYVSQLRINRPHFDAVRGKSEWLLK